MNGRFLTRDLLRQMERENAKRPSILQPIPKNQWPEGVSGCFLSRNFLVQLFNEDWDVIRVSVNRTLCDSEGRWNQNISWDELMEVKRQIGFGEWYAIEVLPRDVDVVNVANIRHFWILAEPLKIGWFK